MPLKTAVIPRPQENFLDVLDGRRIYGRCYLTRAFLRESNEAPMEQRII